MPRIIIITGSTNGIGEATAINFLKNGDNVVVSGPTSESVNEAVSRMNKICDPNQILGVVADVKKEDDAKNLVEATVARFNRIDVLINNAGVAIFKPTENTTAEEWDNVLDVNLRGGFFFTKAVLPIIKKQKHGVIINISSSVGLHGKAGYCAYAASKFGVIGLTEVVADETKSLGIKVYAVCPGPVATKMHFEIHPNEDPSSMMTPEYVAEHIFNLAEGKEKTGTKHIVE